MRKIVFQVIRYKPFQILVETFPEQVEGTRSFLKDAILSNPGWVLQDPMKHPGLLKLRSVQSVPTPSLSGGKILTPHAVHACKPRNQFSF